MIGTVAMTAAGVITALVAVLGLPLLRGGIRVMYAVGMLCLALTWLLPAVLGILLRQRGIDLIPWPANAIVNVVLMSAGPGLLLAAALSRDSES